LRLNNGGCECLSPHETLSLTGENRGKITWLGDGGCECLQSWPQPQRGWFISCLENILSYQKVSRLCCIFHWKINPETTNKFIGYTVKTLSIFPSPAGMSLTKLFLAGNNLGREKIDNHFLQCREAKSIIYSSISWIIIKHVHCTVYTVHAATRIPFMYSFSGNCAASVLISKFMCLWTIYIFPGSVHIFPAGRIGRSFVGIYKSLTVTWMWKLGLWPRNFFFWNICFQFSALVLCSAVLYS
jgi:hypothetical protein